MAGICTWWERNLHDADRVLVGIAINLRPYDNSCGYSSFKNIGATRSVKKIVHFILS